jgi:N-formylglutamate amidohydrolase
MNGIHSQSEAQAIEAELNPPFEVLRPQELKLPFVFNSPHSGRVYPQTFLSASRLDSLALRRSEDCYVEELFSFVAGLGAPLLFAHFPRAYLDVNREPYELDPALFREGLPHFANTQSVRVVGGLGTIARIVSEADEIYREPLTVGAALERINRLYEPYHSTLRALLEEAKALFGFAVLIDCHSMPSSPMIDQGIGRPDFVLGDRFGTSCSSDLIRLASGQLRSLGHAVVLNKPYAGGYITEHYGKPHEGIHALQVEVNRALYMDEASFEKAATFDYLRADLERMVKAIALGTSRLGVPPREAAE